MRFEGAVINGVISIKIEHYRTIKAKLEGEIV